MIVSVPAFSREFSMPSGETFSMAPVANLLDRWLHDSRVIVDPFARNSKRGTITNDLNMAADSMYHLHAEDFVKSMGDVRADAVLFDPPYSPRQVAELYQDIGGSAKRKDTQTARLYKEVKDGLDALLNYGGIAISCGWNSVGFGKARGYELLEVLLVTHGAAHNDTIVVVERKKCAA